MLAKIYKNNELINIVNDLNNNHVVGFPTETVYGLAIVYDSKEAYDKLYEIKHRSITKPISMMVSDTSVLNTVAYIDDRILKVVKAFMPGSLTIVVKAKENLPTHVTFNMKTIGVRIPSNTTALNILKMVNKPLLVTSANISSEPSLLKASDVYNKFNNQIASLVDEDSKLGEASTVVDLTCIPFKILRKGPISEEKINEILGEY